MEFLAGLYTLLLVTICLLLAAVLWKLNKPRNGGDYEELKRWMQQQLDAQAKDFAARQAAMAEQNYTAIRSVSETLQTSVQSMSTTLAQGQSGQQLVGGAEQRPHELVAGKTKTNAEHHRDDRCDPRVRDGFAPTCKLRDVFAMRGEKLLEHIATKAGCCVERSQAEHRNRQNEQRISNVGCTFKTRNHSEHLLKTCRKDLRGRSVGAIHIAGEHERNRAERNDRNKAFQQHTAISDRQRLPFLVELL